MDSMHPLSSSLPPTRRRLDQPELLADFKAAALSVTNIYKTAAASQDKARAAGYQDALEDLITFLDRENLGLMDGEGWRVRQWATERLPDDGVQRQRRQQGSGSEEDTEENETQQANTRSSSPETQRKPQPPSMPVSSSELQESSPRRTAVSEPPPAYLEPAPQPPAAETFEFQSSQIYPSNHDREASTMDLDNSSNMSVPTTPTTEAPTSVRLVARSSRGRHTNHNRRTATAGNTPTINFNLGSGAGSKRKMPYPDFFDISGSKFDGQDRKDGGGGRGGKRGRQV